MAKYRNITTDTLYAVTAGGYIKCAPGEVIDGDDSTYWQTGATGEDALWELVSATAKAKKSQSPNDEGGL
jgi:hypothetical protein